MNKAIKSVIKKYHLPNSSILELRYDGVNIKFDTLSDMEFFFHEFSRKRSLYVEMNPYCYSVTVRAKTQQDEMVKTDARKNELVNLFFEKRREGKDQDAAKEAQEEYCRVHPEYKNAFALIYG